MSAVIKQAEYYIRPMSKVDINAIMAIETRVYDFPWSIGIFQDCLSSAYCCWVLERDKALVAYGIMLVGVGESHILNLCVGRDYQAIGLGKMLLFHLLQVAQEHHATMIFLEVRVSNFVAIKLYLGIGFKQIGICRNYYPAKVGREDALILGRATTQIDNNRWLGLP